MKRIIFFLLLISTLTTEAKSQSFTLDMCYAKAIEYSTISAQRMLQNEIASANIKSVSSNYLPQADLNAQATYQSDVTSLPITLPNITIPTLPQDQYKATIDLQQLIWDGGYIANQKEVYRKNLDIENSKIDLSQSNLKDRVNSIYLGILLLEDNISLIELQNQTINGNISLMRERLTNGVVMKSNVDILEVEQMKIEQRLLEARYNRKVLIAQLSALLGENINESAKFEIPQVTYVNYGLDSKRPEYGLFSAQRASMAATSAMLGTKNMPKIAAFAQGGYGRPGLNMLSPNFDSYFIVGARLTVPLTKWTATRHEKRVIASQESLIDQQQEDFTRNNRAQIVNQISEIEKYRELIESDKAIVEKHRQITISEQEKMLNGVSTSQDYITEFNAENQAELSQKLHEIQLIQAIINYNSLTGNN